MVLPAGMLDSGIGSQVGSTRFWTFALPVLVSALAIIGIFGFLATAAISPLTANRALPVRVYVTAVWFLTGLGAGVWGIAVRDFAWVEAWACLHLFLYSIGFFVAVCERESLGRRVQGLSLIHI